MLITRLLSYGIALLIAFTAQAQSGQPYQFKQPIKLRCTPVKNQQKTGTCWSFSTVSFLESELMRRGKGEHDLSEMFVVRNIYRDKCENYVRRQGAARLGEGGLAHDVINAVRRYGIVPESFYSGRKDPDAPLNHANLEAALIKICDEAVAQGKKGALRPEWIARVDSVLDAEMGPLPKLKFTYDNLPMSPLRFRDHLGIVPDDYVNITSFSHRPFYESFILEVPDNFSNGSFYNVPLEELMLTLDNALNLGFTVEWDADVSNRDFSHQQGVAIVPAKDWKDKTEAERGETFKSWEKERPVTQEYRQEMFDRQITQDDHLMHIVGYVSEGHGKTFYVVKNSWGDQTENKGFVYVSPSYMGLNTISITVHKDAVPTKLRDQLALAPTVNPLPGKKTRRLDNATPASSPENMREMKKKSKGGK